MSDYPENERKNWAVKKKRYTPTFEKETMKDVAKLQSFAWPERNIRQETMETFGIKCSLSESDRSIEKVFFPYYDQDNKLSGYKVKDLTKHKKEEGHFYTIGYVGVTCKLFGQKECDGPKTNLRIVEGESDFLSAYQVLSDRQTSSKTPEQYRHLKPQIVGIGCGTVNAVEHISNNIKFVNKYGSIWLAFDNDWLSDIEKLKANPGMKGREATEAVGSYLVGRDRNIYVTAWPEDINDCSDALQQERGDELAEILLFKKDEFCVEKIISVEDIPESELLKPKEKGVYVNSFPLLMDKLWGLRKRELTVLTAMSGVGKTVVCSEIAYQLAEQTQEPIALVFLEERSEETLMRMIARRLQINYYKFVFNPLKYCTKEQFHEAYGWVNNKFFFLDVFGSIKVNNLIDSFKNFVFVSGCGYIVFDHVSMLASGSTVKDERRLIDLMMTELAAFTAQTDVGVFAVSHLSRQASTEIGKISDLKEPTWINVRKEHLKGSSSIEQLAWNVVGLDMLLLPSRERSDVRLTVLKNRSIGLLGVTDQFHTDPETGLIKLTNTNGY